MNFYRFYVGNENVKKLEDTKASKNSCGMSTYMDYLDYMKNPKIFGIEHGLIMLCEFL
jgi:hypothetical protein